MPVAIEKVYERTRLARHPVSDGERLTCRLTFECLPLHKMLRTNDALLVAFEASRGGAADDRET